MIEIPSDREPPTDRLVFVPCRLNRRDGRTALIEDADEWPFYIWSPLGRVDGRLCAAARWLRAAGGRHRVQFGDGFEAWVVEGPRRQEDFIPLSWGAMPRRRRSSSSATPVPGA